MNERAIEEPYLEGRGERSRMCVPKTTGGAIPALTLRRVLAQAPLALFVLDPKGRILMAEGVEHRRLGLEASGFGTQLGCSARQQAVAPT